MLPLGSHLEMIQSVACSRQPQPSRLPPSCTVHAPLTSHPTYSWAYFTPAIFPPDLSVECSPRSEIHRQAVVYCINLMPLSFFFHKGQINGILAGLPFCSLCSHTNKRSERTLRMAISGSNGLLTNLLLSCLLPSFSPTSNLALSVLTQY